MGRFAIRWLLHSLMWGLGGSMDAKGRAELGEVLIHHSGLAPPLDGADLTSLQVGPRCRRIIALMSCGLNVFFLWLPLWLSFWHTGVSETAICASRRTALVKTHVSLLNLTVRVGL